MCTSFRIHKVGDSAGRAKIIPIKKGLSVSGNQLFFHSDSLFKSNYKKETICLFVPKKKQREPNEVLGEDAKHTSLTEDTF